MTFEVAQLAQIEAEAMQDEADRASAKLDAIGEQARAEASGSPPQPDEFAEPDAMDVVDLEGEETDEALPMVIEGLLGPREVIAITGEEGDGKTTFSDQLCRQMHRGEDVFGCFPVGELRPISTLFMDTHQEEPEIRRRARDMKARGLGVERGQIHWWWSGGSDPLSDMGAREALEHQLEITGAQFLWIDAASHAVRDPKDDVEVRTFFDYLSEVMRRYDLLGVGLTLYPRKRPAGEYARRFDDLFGSREWKGRITTALYLDSSKIVCWKDRGRRLRRVWPVKNRYATAILQRPGLADDITVPFVIEAGEADEEIDRDALKEKVLQLVEDSPGIYAKTPLANGLGINNQKALEVVNELLAEGRIGPNKRGAKLRLLGPKAEQSTI